MDKALLVCSKSTKRYLEKYERVMIIDKPPTKAILDIAQSEDRVVAIGGGAVIDSAKIISKTPITCYPTTAAGSSDTKHSVYWDGERKMNFTSHVPNIVIINNDAIKTLPKPIIYQTRCDLISHCIDSLHSKKADGLSINLCTTALQKITESKAVEDLIAAGRLGGKAIQITTTNLLHALSYPLTGRYDISHGIALSYLISKLTTLFNTFYDIPNILGSSYMKYTAPVFNMKKIDWDWVIDEAYTYNKIEDFSGNVNKEILRELL